MKALPDRVREPAVAGQFYAAEPDKLRRGVRNYLIGAREPDPPCDQVPKAIIAPHAGYIYSGPIAGSAFHPFQTEAAPVRRIILIGPAHYVAFRGIALSTAAAFATPLGRVPLDRESAERLSTLPQVHFFDEAHEPEHSLEVELPFLQTLFEAFTVVPMVVGEATDAEVSALLEAAWGGPETRVVVSSDLSHRLDYATACAVDRKTARAIETGEGAAIEGHHACGYRPIRGLLRVTRSLNLTARTIDLRNSGDTAGSRDRVVGYGAFHFGN